MIQFIADDIEFPNIDTKKINRWIKKITIEYGKKLSKINYIFCSDKRILEINMQYLLHDYYTDIITFDYSVANIISGDIFISIDTINSNAVKFNVSFEKEILRIIIHGLLHLCGQNDKTDDEAIEMTRKENNALSKF